MVTIKKIKLFLCNRKKRFSILSAHGLLNWMSDKEWIKIAFHLSLGYKLDLENPKTFNEKIQWLKLNDRNPIYTLMVDKYEVKKYIGDIIGSKYIIPTYGIWNSFDEICFDKLPKQFVLKCTHDSGGVVVVRDKDTFDKNAAKKKINRCLNRNYYYSGREWPYKNVKPRIIAEKNMEELIQGEEKGSQQMIDYKIFTFNGIPKIMFIATDRENAEVETKFDFYDMEFNHLKIINGHPCAEVPPDRPKNFEEMKLLAKKISKGFPHMRVDFYEVNGNVYFGEITLAHWSGLVPFEPQEWDIKLGEWLEINR